MRIGRIAPCADCNRTRQVVGRGLCQTCYLRNYRGGTLERYPAKRAEPLESKLKRFVVVQTNGCWVWTGPRTKKGLGYGQTASAKHAGSEPVHRLVWESERGPIPPGVLVLHTCDNPPCVRPDHLFLGDTIANKADCVAKGRQARGEKIATSKLTTRAVIEIRKSALSTPALAAAHHVSGSAILKARKKVTWRHVELSAEAGA